MLQVATQGIANWVERWSFVSMEVQSIYKHWENILLLIVCEYRNIAQLQWDFSMGNDK